MLHPLCAKHSAAAVADPSAAIRLASQNSNLEPQRELLSQHAHAHTGLHASMQQEESYLELLPNTGHQANHI